MPTHRNMCTLWLLLLLHVAGGTLKISHFNSNVTVVDSTHSLDHSGSLSDELGQIFDSGNGCDFLILVQSEPGSTEEDGTPEMSETTICAHKLMISQFPLFTASESATSITVSLSQSCRQLFTSFIRYIYTRKVDVTFSSVQCLHGMASKFGVKQLIEDTSQLLYKILPEDPLFHTQVSLYEYAEETGDTVLQKNCIQYLAWNYQNLASSPAWNKLSVKLLIALLSRSDLVVPDEYFLLQTVEKWIKERGNLTSLETQADLLRHIRFPMIPAEKLYEIEANSSLYQTHYNMYHDKLLKAYQFNVLLFSKLPLNAKFNKEDDSYLPRMYTAEPWSILLDPSKEVPSPARTFYPLYNRRNRYNYGYDQYIFPTPSPYGQTITESFSTPVHNSLIFKDNKIQWEANVLKRQQECSSRGLNCRSFPAARLAPQNQLSQNNVRFRNQLLLMCQGKYISQVQDFKDDLAYVTVDGAHVVPYPCPGNQFTYRFIVRPEYF